MTMAFGKLKILMTALASGTFLSSNSLANSNSTLADSLRRILDLSFNVIGKVENLDALQSLETLYLASNKIGSIEGLEHLSNLRVLELGANEIKV